MSIRIARLTFQPVSFQTDLLSCYQAIIGIGVNFPDGSDRSGNRLDANRIAHHGFLSGADIF